MPAPEFFRQAGFVVRPDFLNPEYIALLRREMASAPSEKATVVTPEGTECLDESTRKVEARALPKEIRAPLKEKFLALIPDLERHFNVQIDGFESPSYLVYSEGDFFTPHSDGGSPDQTDSIKRRLVSAVIFLNSESGEPGEGSFGGGRLTFHGLLEGPMWERCAFPVKPEPGLLVAFPSQKIHEVTRISHGQRFTVVTWFYAPESEPDQSSTEPVPPQ